MSMYSYACKSTWSNRKTRDKSLTYKRFFISPADRAGTGRAKQDTATSNQAKPVNTCQHCSIVGSGTSQQLSPHHQHSILPLLTATSSQRLHTHTHTHACMRTHTHTHTHSEKNIVQRQIVNWIWHQAGEVDMRHNKLNTRNKRYIACRQTVCMAEETNWLWDTDGKTNTESHMASSTWDIHLRMENCALHNTWTQHYRWKNGHDETHSELSMRHYNYIWENKHSKTDDELNMKHYIYRWQNEHCKTHDELCM